MRKPAAAWHIDDGLRPRPATHRTIYADGAADDGYRPGVDLELSHWQPNRTPAAFRADTSTEICVRWLRAGPGPAPTELSPVFRAP